MSSIESEITKRTDPPQLLTFGGAEDISDAERARSMKVGLFEGALSALYASLCGGVFVIGLAVSLGAGEITVGVISAAPFFAMMATFLGSYLVERGMSRRKVSRGSMFVARLIWAPFLAAYPFFMSKNTSTGLWVLVGLMLFSSLAGAVGQISWLGWMAEVVPIKDRGRYFGARNAIVGLVTTVAIYLGGRMVEWNFGHESRTNTMGYFALFIIGTAAGLAAIYVLGRISGGGPETPSVTIRPSFGELIGLPMKEPNFRRFLRFQFVWMFGVYMSAPFFAVVMLRELGAGIQFVALVTSIGALANVLTFRGWGALADRYGNKPIIMLCVIVSSSFPLWWFLINPNNYRWPLIVLHFIGGISWAGYSLASNNLLLRLSPAEHNSIYLSLFNSLTGLSTAVGPLIGGVLGYLLDRAGVGKWFYPLLGVFLVSTVIRSASAWMAAKVREPEEAPVIEVLRVLRSARGFNTLMGFDAIVQFFLMPAKKNGPHDQA